MVNFIFLGALFSLIAVEVNALPFFQLRSMALDGNYQWYKHLVTPPIKTLNAFNLVPFSFGATILLLRHYLQVS